LRRAAANGALYSEVAMNRNKKTEEMSHRRFK